MWDLFHSFYFWNSCSQPSLQYITFVSTSTQCESLNKIWDKHKNLLIFVCKLLFDARPCPSGNHSSLVRKAVCMLSIIILLFHPLNSWSDWTKEVASVYEPNTLLEDDHTTAGKPMFWQNIRWLRKNTEIFFWQNWDQTKQVRTCISTHETIPMWTPQFLLILGNSKCL